MRLFPLVDGFWNRFDRGGTLTRPFDINLLRQRGGSSVARRVGGASRVHRRENTQDEVDLSAFVADSIDDRLTTSDTALFSPAYANGQANTWNTSCWAADFDFSGISMYNDQASYLGGVAVTKRHVLFATHRDYTPNVGTTLYFVDSNGAEVTREVADRNVDTFGYQLLTASYNADIGIVYLDEDLPNTVATYKVFDPYADFSALAVDSPVVIMDQEEKALVGVIESISETYRFPGLSILYGPGSSPRDENWENLVDGDSGHPTFLAMGNELVLIGIHSGRVSGVDDSLIDSNLSAYVPDSLMDTYLGVIDADETGHLLSAFDTSHSGELLGSSTHRGIGKSSAQIRRTP